jgi:TonB family protein
MNAAQKQVGLRTLENGTFKELGFSHKGLWISLAGSYIFHLTLVAFLFYLYTQSLKFVVPHVVMTGRDAHGITHLYWLPGNRGSGSLSRTRKPVISNRFAPKGMGNVFRFGRNLPKKNSNKQVAASALESLGDASSDGDDIRPALPIATPDPVVTPADLAGGLKGDVIVEVTIDSNGNMVATKIEHGLGRAVDRKVLAAIEGWRFRPAMKDGRPIPSKQDIHYHFPINDVGPTKPQEAPLAASLTQPPCPVLLVSGTADQNHISITFINMGKLPIRQLEFNCGPRNSIIGTMADLSLCRKNNALFYPGQEYTLDYANQQRSHHIQISIKTVILSDGYVWQPSRGQSCRTVTIDDDQHVH